MTAFILCPLQFLLSIDTMSLANNVSLCPAVLSIFVVVACNIVQQYKLFIIVDWLSYNKKNIPLDFL